MNLGEVYTDFHSTFFELLCRFEIFKKLGRKENFHNKNGEIMQCLVIKYKHKIVYTTIIAI